MSVLYKALQKAQKENEQRQPAAVASDSASATSAVRLAAPSINWRLAGIGVAVLLAVVIGAAMFLFDDSAPPPAPVAVRPPAPAAAPAAQRTAPQQTAALQPPATQAPNAAAPAAQPATAQLAPPAQPGAPAVAAPDAQTPTATPAVQAAPTPAAPVQAVPAPASEAAVAKASEAETSTPLASDEPVALTPKKAVVEKAAAKSVKPSAPTPQPMPQLAADSPARVLNPPIAIKRGEYDFGGVGDSVQVRRVSQQAQDNVTSGYNALVRGDHEMALGFYERALQQEPRSILAQLGRGAALQKLGRSDEARVSYERVLKVDPQNREALTNLTAIVAEREPGEALRRLQGLEREYPSFSPIKAQMGLVYAKLGQFEPALDYLRRAVTLTPDAPMYNYNLALVLDRLNRHDQAVAIYERVLATAAAGRLPPDIPLADIERRVRFLRNK